MPKSNVFGHFKYYLWSFWEFQIRILIGINFYSFCFYKTKKAAFTAFVISTAWSVRESNP